MRRVLVVDDNVGFADNLAAIIGDCSVADSVVADYGERALELVRARRVDVLVTDRRMPGSDGADLIERVRAEDPTLPIVIVTASGGAAALDDVGAKNAGRSALVRELVETLRARGVACVAAGDGSDAVLLRAPAEIALFDSTNDDDDGGER